MQHQHHPEDDRLTDLGSVVSETKGHGVKNLDADLTPRIVSSIND